MKKCGEGNSDNNDPVPLDSDTDKDGYVDGYEQFR